MYEEDETYTFNNIVTGDGQEKNMRTIKYKTKGVIKDGDGEKKIEIYYLKDDSQKIKSFVHDVPLYPNPNEKSIVNMVDNEKCCLVVTTGGTGPAKRDVTPEATEAVCDRMMPGFGELMRSESLKFVPTAILSRQTAGLRGSSLIVNLPGKPKSIRECLDAVSLPYPIV